ncbi:MAG: iron-sulfur cluster assembly scaffold protein [bacterium]|nr:iron-sulfur cluster assembly scaffold protein [bacterium]
MYSKQLLEHFQNPRNVGELGPPAISVEVSNPACGDIMRLAAIVTGGRIIEVRYQTRGCTASVAAGSALSEWMTGRDVGELEVLNATLVGELVGGLPAESKHAAVLCVDAVRAWLRAAASDLGGYALPK